MQILLDHGDFSESCQIFCSCIWPDRPFLWNYLDSHHLLKLKFHSCPFLLAQGVLIASFFQAIDPENDPVTYSIASGNDLRQFSIGDRTGVITVRRKLDREDLNRYQLVSYQIINSE